MLHPTLDSFKDLDKLSTNAKAKSKGLQGKAKEQMDSYAAKADELRGRVKTAITNIKSGDEGSDDISIDKLLSDANALKDKVVAETKALKK